MIQWKMLGILIILTTSLAAQSSELAVGVQPSSEIRYPDKKDLINPIAQGKADSAKIAVLHETASLLKGWYLQIILLGDENSVVDKAVSLVPLFPEFKLFLRPRNGEWRLLIGPLEDNQLHKTLKIAESLGLTAVLRRESGS